MPGHALFPGRTLVMAAAFVLLTSGTSLQAQVVGTAGTDGTSITNDDVPSSVSTTVGIDGGLTDLTAIAGIANGDSVDFNVNGTVTTVVINTGDTLVDFANAISAISGVTASVTNAGINDTITISPENVNTQVVAYNSGGTPLTAFGFGTLPGTLPVMTTPGGDGADGGIGQTQGAGLTLSISSTIAGGAGGKGGKTLYNLAATDGGDAGDGAVGISYTGTNLQTLTNTSTITGGAGGEGGAGTGGGNDGADGTGGVGISNTNAAAAGFEIINSGTISGGLGGDGATRAKAINLVNSGNTLTLKTGSSVIGDVVLGSSAGTLKLDGTGTEDSNFKEAQTILATNGTTWTLSGDFELAAGGIMGITTAGNSKLTMGGTLDADDLIKAGTGTLVLTGNNSAFAGTTKISAGTLQVGNGGTSGSLNGNITNNSALIFYRSDALSYGGVISGTGSLTKSGAGTLTLSGANSFSGGTTISAGTISLGAAERLADSGSVTVNAGATFNLNNFNERIGDLAGAGSIVLGTGNLTAGTASSSTFSGAISGTGAFSKQGSGSLTLTGTNTYTGGTTISGGKLVVNGSTGAITLNGGALGGSGTVGTVNANSGSTIAPGNSIGTLNVAGNTSLANGSTYAVEVDKDGNADKIAATGTVAIDNGAKVTVSAENGSGTGSTYAVATTYTIVTAGAGVTGTFGSVSDNFAFLDASLSYDANSVYLKLFRNDFSFASSAATANQRATAAAMDTLGSGNTVYDAVSVLSAAKARSAFDSLSGEVYASANGLLMQDSHFGRDAVVARMRSTFDGVAEGDEAQPYGRGAVWGHAYGTWGHTDSDGNAARLTHSAGGFHFGADGLLPGDWVAGVFAGHGASSFASGARVSSGTVNSYELGSYAGGRFGNLGVRLGSSVAWHDVAAARNVKLGSFRDALSAEYSAATTQVFGELSYTLDTGLARFEPFAGAALVYQHSNGFSETGGASALSVASASQTLGLTTLGLRTETYLATTGSFTALLTGSLGWRHAIGDVATSTNMRFASGDAFRIAGTAIDRDTALIQAGLKLDFDSGATFNLDYRGELGSRTRSHGVAARFKMAF